MTAQKLVELQNRVPDIHIDPSLIDYVIHIGHATRSNGQLPIGMSPRGSLALLQTVRVTTMMHKRDYVVLDSIISNIQCACVHRVISKTHMHDADDQITARIMQQMLGIVPSPA